jgi:hypothetical protein
MFEWRGSRAFLELFRASIASFKRVSVTHCDANGAGTLVMNQNYCPCN